MRGKHRGEHRYRKQVSVERCNVEGKRKDVSEIELVEATFEFRPFRVVGTFIV